VAESGRRASRLPVAEPARGIPRSLLLAALAVDGAVVLPVVVVVDQAVAGGWRHARFVLSHAGLASLVVHTLAVFAVVTPLCGILGLATAYAVERTDLPGRRFWRLLMVAPLTVPAFVTSYAWVTLSSAFSGYAGAVVVTSATYFPLVFLMVSASLRGLDPALEESARSLGCTPWRVFFRVLLPQVKPALAGGMLLVALDSLVEFDAFAALKFQTFSTDVYAQYTTSLSVSSAAVLSLVSILFCLVILGGEARLRGGAEYTRISNGAIRPPALYGTGSLRWAWLAAMLAIAGASVAVPIAMLAYWFTQASHAALSSAASGIGFLAPATVTSVGLGVAASALALAMALPIALVAVRYRSRLSRSLERAVYLAFALPDLVGAIALGYLAVHWARPLYESLPLLVLAYAILFVPLAVVAVRATVAQVEPRMEDCARSLGAGGLASFTRVTLPVARPGIAAAGVLVFAFVIGDLSTTQVLLPPGMYDLATQFWSNSSTVAFAAAAPYAAVLVALAMGSAYVLMGSFGRVRSATA
jgi:iron(III) transport system permease protein